MRKSIMVCGDWARSKNGDAGEVLKKPGGSLAKTESAMEKAFTMSEYNGMYCTYHLVLQ